MNTEHETRDADVGTLFLIAIIVFLAGALICLGVWVLLRSLQVRERARETAAPRSATATAFPSPQLEPQPGLELATVRAEEDARLHSYGWIEKDKGLVHIPIERAMDLIVARGLPDVGAGQTRLQLMQSRPSQDRQ